MADPTYVKELILANPVWHVAWVLSEIQNDNAPIGWSKYIGTAECLLAAFEMKAIVMPAPTDARRERIAADRMYHCKSHGDWNALVVSGCPECVIEMRAKIDALEKALLELLCLYDGRLITTSTVPGAKSIARCRALLTPERKP